MSETETKVPKAGESFVEMDASPGEWDESVEVIDDVIGRHWRSRDQWVVQWTDAIDGARLTLIEWRDGKWRRAP